jgi:hypothetical protein
LEIPYQGFKQFILFIVNSDVAGRNPPMPMFLIIVFFVVIWVYSYGFTLKAVWRSVELKGFATKACDGVLSIENCG